MLPDKLVSNSTSLQRTAGWRQTTITTNHQAFPRSRFPAISHVCEPPPAACVHVAISWKGRAGPCMDAEIRTKEDQSIDAIYQILLHLIGRLPLWEPAHKCDGEMYSEQKHTTPDCASGVPFHRMRGVVEMRNEKEQKLSKSKPHSKN
jgi:hypothetical protein